MANQQPDPGLGWNLIPDPAGKGAEQQYSDADWRQYVQHLFQQQQHQQQQQPPAQQAFMDQLLANQQAMATQLGQQAQLGQQGQVGPKNFRKLDPPSMPHPKDWRNFARQVEEFRIEAREHSEFNQVRALKCALPDDIQIIAGEHMDVPAMEKAGAVDVLVAWLKNRYGPLDGVESLQVLEDWEKFERKGTDLRRYVDEFEQMVVRMLHLGKTVQDKKEIFLVKAQLPEDLKSELSTAMHRLVQNNSAKTDWDYEDLKQEMLLISSKRKELFQRHINYQKAQTIDELTDGFTRFADRREQYGDLPGATPLSYGINCKHHAAGRCKFGQSCRYVHESNRHGGDDRHINWMRQDGKGKGKGKDLGWSPRHPSESRWSRGRTSDRSRSPRSGRDASRSPTRPRYTPSRYTDRSPSRMLYRDRSRSPSKGKGKGKEICRDNLRGKCRWGNTCRHSHSTGGADHSRNSTKSPPRFGSQSPGRGAPSRSPRPFGGRR